MEAHEHVHDQVRSRPPVIDVADEVQMIERKTLDEHAHGLDEVRRLAAFDDRLDDGSVIRLLVDCEIALGHELLDDVGVIGRHGLAHLRAGVLPRRLLRHGHQPQQRFGVPGIGIRRTLKLYRHLLARVEDQRGKRALLGIGERVSERVLELELHSTRPVSQYVRESLVFAMDVRCEHLGALREVQDGGQVDYLGGSLGRCGKRPCQQLQIPFLAFLHCHPLVINVGNTAPHKREDRLCRPRRGSPR